VTVTALARPSVALRHRLEGVNIKLRSMQTVRPGKIMFWGGGRFLACTELNKAREFYRFPDGADQAWLWPADYEAVREE